MFGSNSELALIGITKVKTVMKSEDLFQLLLVFKICKTSHKGECQFSIFLQKLVNI